MSETPDVTVIYHNRLPGIPPMLVLCCECGQELRRIRKQTGCTTSVWACQGETCEKKYRIVEAE